MRRRIPTNSSLLSESARPPAVWSDKIMNALGLLFALLSLVVLAAGVCVSGLAFSR